MKLIELCLLGAFSTSCGMETLLWDMDSPKRGVMPDPLNFTANLSLSTYESCQEIAEDFAGRRDRLLAHREAVRKAQAANRNDRVASTEAGQAAPTEEVSNEADDSIANNQESGIEETDFLKRTADHILVTHGTQLEVIDRSSRTLLGTLDLSQEFQEINWGGKLSSINVYTEGNRLLLHGRSPEGRYMLKTYDLATGAMPVKAWEYEIAGDVFDSRLVDGKMYVISNFYDGELSNYVYGYGDGKLQFADGRHSTTNIPCQSIVKTSYNDYNTNITSVRSIDVTGAEPVVKEAHLLGATGSEIYMGPRQIVLFTPIWQSSRYRPASSRFMTHNKTMITRLDYDSTTGDIAGMGRVEVNGFPTQGQWAFKEMASGHTAVVTTSHDSILSDELFENHEVGRNHLFILEPAEDLLKVVGGAINFGKPHEDVRSVRFVDQHAYVVTFEKTDPLYSFNLLDPAKPVMEDALEIPGFSTYMHPITDSLMVGLGFDAVDMGDYSLYQGIQLSLFDNSDPTNLARIDNIIFGERGSYSDATGNHLAFFADNNSELFGFPLVELNHSIPTDEPWAYGDRLEFAGAVLYQPSYAGEVPQLEEVGRLTHSDMMPADCQQLLSQGRWWQEINDSYEINRIFREGDAIVSVSRFGIKFHDPSQEFAVSSRLRFSSSCERYYYYETMPD